MNIQKTIERAPTIRALFLCLKTEVITIYVRDLTGNEYACQATVTNEYELNGNRELSATILPSKVNRLFIEDIAEMWEITDFDDVAHKIVYAKKKGEGRLLTVEIKAVPLFFDTFDTERIYDEYNEHMTAMRCFTLIFEDSGFNFVLVDSFDAIDWQGLGGGETRLEMFKRALNRYGAEFRISGNTIYLHKQVGRDTQFQYRHRLNASNIVQENDATAMWTYAKGYGDYEEGDEEGGGGWENANLIREYTSPLANIPQIGIRHAPPIKDGRISDKTTMDKALKELVDESLKISVTAGIHDLRRQGYPLAQPELGDRVFLIDERIGLDEEVRVVDISITRNWKGEVTDLKLTFGSESITKRYQSNLQTAIKDIQGVMSGNKKLPYSVLDNAVLRATEALRSAQTELVFSDNGILAIDKNDPNLVTLFNSAGLGVSRDGGATFENAITGEGINASVIYTGSMLADRIAGGILQSLNGNTHFNLNTGKLDMKQANFELGDGARIIFTDPQNKLQYTHNNYTSGLGVSEALNEEYPFVYIGTVDGSSLVDFEPNRFSGFIANTTARYLDDGAGNSVIGRRFSIITKSINTDPNYVERGFRFLLDSNDKSFYPINTGTHAYELGRSGNRWDEVHARTYYGSLASTSTYNAKISIEDVDGEQAFDYFDMMNIK